MLERPVKLGWRPGNIERSQNCANSTSSEEKSTILSVVTGKYCHAVSLRHAHGEQRLGESPALFLELAVAPSYGRVGERGDYRRTATERFRLVLD